MHDPIGTAGVGRAGAVGARSGPAGKTKEPRRAGTATVGGLWAVHAVRGTLALILLSCALVIPALPVYADEAYDLIVAAQEGTAEEVKAALAAGADPAFPGHDLTALHVAAGKNPSPAVIQALLEAGADPDARNEDGLTPLYVASALNPNPDVIAALIEGGAVPGRFVVDQADSAGPCRIDDWRWQYESMFNMITIDGTTTCETGWITIRAYDGDGEFFGTHTGIVMGHAFQGIIDTSRKPSSLTIKHTIKRNLF